MVVVGLHLRIAFSHATHVVSKRSRSSTPAYEVSRETERPKREIDRHAGVVMYGDVLQKHARQRTA